jgi:type IV secretory pathway TrbL component
LNLDCVYNDQTLVEQELLTLPGFVTLVKQELLSRPGFVTLVEQELLTLPGFVLLNLLFSL